MVTVEVEIGIEDLRSLRTLAELHYGDSGPPGINRVVEMALGMRLLWGKIVLEVGDEVGEPVIEWSQGEDDARSDNPDAEISEWLFRDELRR